MDATDTPELLWEPVESVSPAEKREECPGRRKWPSWALPALLGLVGTGAQFLAVRGFVGISSAPVLSVAALGRDLPAGHVVRPEDLVSQPLEAELCGRAFFENADEVVGLRLKGGMSAGSPLPRGALSSPGSSGAFLEKIPLGKRLFLLRADLGVLSGVLKRGDRIDVVGNLDLPGKGFVTKTLLQGVPIAALGSPQAPKGEGSGAEVISLFLEPRDVEFLVHAQRLGSLSVALRNPGEAGEGDGGEGMTETQFLNDKRIQDVYENDLFRIEKGAGDGK